MFTDERDSSTSSRSRGTPLRMTRSCSGLGHHPPSNPASATRAVLDALFRHATVVINEHVWEEARRNTAMKRPGLMSSLEGLKTNLQLSAKMAIVTKCSLPDNDQPVLGGAVASGCSHLWTGDKRHYGHLYGKTINGTLVVSATVLADEVIRKGWMK